MVNDKDLSQILLEYNILSVDELKGIADEVSSSRQRGHSDKTLLQAVVEKGIISNDRIMDLFKTDQRADVKSIPSEVVARLENKKFRIGKYVMLNQIGSGGCGVVFKAYDVVLKRYVALKFLNNPSSEQFQRFKKEAEIVAGISHPNIVQIYEIGEHDGKCFIAMQLVNGKTLSDIIDEHGIKKIIRIIRDVCLALEAVHEYGIIHRDLKPKNIMVGEDGRVYVMDFGIAKSGDSELTVSGFILGTPMYMSPEQARSDHVDIRSDIYSLGATLYQCLTGFHPFAGRTSMEIIENVIKNDPVAPRKANPRLPADLDVIVRKCMMKESMRRYQNVRQLRGDLDSYLNDEPIKARAPTLAYILSRKIKKYRIYLVSGLALVVVMLAVMLPLYSKGTNDADSSARSEVKSVVESADRLLDQALLDERIRNFDKALELTKKAIELNPLLASAYTLAGRIEFLKQRYQNSLNYFIKAKELRPNLYQSYVNLGATYHNLNRYSDAISEYKIAFELAKKN
ncbi:MAG: serine/threonine protein kinase, partial [Planctomycetes bacterium]|nr:serine/threonine protein kinase [Planctomycetota bacterium]